MLQRASVSGRIILRLRGDDDAAQLLLQRARSPPIRCIPGGLGGANGGGMDQLGTGCTCPGTGQPLHLEISHPGTPREGMQRGNSLEARKVKSLVELPLHRAWDWVKERLMKGKVSSAAGSYWPIIPKWGDRQVCLIT